MQEENNNFIIEDTPLYNKEDIIKKIEEIQEIMGMDKETAIAFGIDSRFIPDIDEKSVQEEWELTEEDVKEIYGTEE